MNETRVFSTLLLMARKRAKMTQADVAEWAGCNQKTISNYEHRHRVPNVGMVCALASGMNMSHDETVEVLNSLLSSWCEGIMLGCVCEQCRAI